MKRLLFIGLLLPSLVGAEPGPRPREVRFDRDGDRLPDGAFCRLGTTRYREHAARQMTINPEGTQAICSDQESVRIWDLQTGKRLHMWYLPHLFHGAVSADGRFALNCTSSTDNEDACVELWDTPHNRRLWKSSVPDVDYFRATAFAPNHKTVITVESRTGFKSRIREWDTATGKSRFFDAPDSSVNWIHILREGKRVLLCRWPSDGVACFDIATGRELYRLEKCFAGIEQEGTSFLVTGQGKDQWINAEDGKVIKDLQLPKFTQFFSSLALTRHGPYFVHCRDDKGTQYFNLNTTEIDHSFPQYFNLCTPAPKTSANTKAPTVWFSGAGLVEAELTKNGKIVRGATRTEGLLSPPAQFAWSTNQKLFLMKTYGGDEEHFDLRTQRPITKVAAKPQWFEQGNNFAPLNDTLPIATNNPPLRQPNGELLAGVFLFVQSPERHFTLALKPISYRRDGSKTFADADLTPLERAKLSTVDGSRWYENVVVYERATGRELCTLPATVVDAPAFTPDGRRIVTLEATRFRIWDALTGQELLRREVPFTEPLPIMYRFGNGMAFSPDGKQLAIGNRDTTVLIWDAAIPDEKPAALKWEELQPLWDDLASSDPKVAWKAIKRLRKDPARALALLGEQLKPVRGLPDADAQQLLRELEDPMFRVRQQAMKKVLNYGDAAQAFVEESLKNAKEIDLRQRLTTLMESYGPTTPARGEDLRSLRALAVLQTFLKRDEVRAKLTEIAEGLPNARVTKEAKAALERVR